MFDHSSLILAIRKRREEEEEAADMRDIPSWVTLSPGESAPKARPVTWKRRKENELSRCIEDSIISQSLYLNSPARVPIPLFKPSPPSPSTVYYSDDDVDMLEDDTDSAPEIEPTVQCKYGGECDMRFTRAMDERAVKEHLEERHGACDATAALQQSRHSPWPAQVELVDALNPALIRVLPQGPASRIEPPVVQSSVCAWASCGLEMSHEALPKHVQAHIDAVWTSTSTEGVQWRWTPGYQPPSATKV